MLQTAQSLLTRITKYCTATHFGSSVRSQNKPSINRVLRTESGVIKHLSSGMCLQSLSPKESKNVDYAAVGTAALKSAIRGVVPVSYSKRKVFLLLCMFCVLVGAVVFASLYTFHQGFRRTVQFWTGMGPLVAEHRFLKYKAKYFDGWDEDADEYKVRMRDFNQRAAPKIVDLIQSLGGIYIKIGQVMSTLGQGLLPKEYVKALRPLQDGVPPRDITQISTIIEKSTGKKMDDIFVSFDEKPIGSASIAQAHRATLRAYDGSVPNEEVIVKVQYPEVAELFDADLNNLEMVTKLFMPENRELVKALRERHENELDFRIEADNLRECTQNMQAHGVEPSLVRIPRVKNETGICTQHVLVMEYLRGTSLAEAIELEQNRIANVLGKEDGEELRSVLAERMREHFENGGGAGSGGMELLGSKKAKLAQVAGPLAAKLLRTYAGVREKVNNIATRVQNIGGVMVKGITCGAVNPKIRPIDRKGQSSVGHINLGRVLKTLVHVHGLQMLQDGVYNADPHPGNVVVMEDGKLGLLDYGMVGRLSVESRETVAKTVLALSRKDKKEAARLYRDAGYKATNWDGEIIDDGILHRFATFHLDKIDLSPVTLDDGEKMDTIKLLRSVRERSVPDWVEQARRLGGLLMGVSAQAARPISLAREWEAIASKSLDKNVK